MSLPTSVSSHALRLGLTGAYEGDRRQLEMPHQSGLTWAATVRPGRVDVLRSLLAEIGRDPAGNPHVPFGAVGGVHYARLFLLDATTDLSGKEIGPQLFFMADFDSPLDARLDRLVAVGAKGWDRILGECVGFAPGGPAACKRFMLEHRLSDSAYYVNTVGLGVDQVLLECRLREALEAELDANLGLRGLDPASVRRSLVAAVDRLPELRPALAPAKPPELTWRIAELIHLLAIPLAGLILLPLEVIALPFWLIALRRHERSDAESAEKPTPAHTAALEAIEDHGPVNQFTAIGFIKPGWFRALTARLVLFLIAYGARHIFNHGNLAGVKTIHFARWTFIDGGRRVIFASNYDGSLESYMDDFIDKVAWGLNAVFSNGAGYPATRWLLWGGATKETAFKNFLRAHQEPTEVWYSAYPALTALNIVNNSAVRAGLRRQGGDSEWLRRL
jgi:hypothetical protein